MKLSSLIQFAFLALPSVIAKSMYFDIRAQIDIADEVKVMGKHESDEDFVELPRNWRDDDENPGACMTEAGALSWSTSNGACGDKPLYTIVAAFPGIRAGRNSAQIEMPGHTLKCNFTATDDDTTRYITGWGLGVNVDYVNLDMTCFNETV